MPRNYKQNNKYDKKNSYNKNSKYPTISQNTSPVNESIELNPVDSAPVANVSNSSVKTQSPRPRPTKSNRKGNTKASTRYQSRNFSSHKTPTFDFEMNMSKTSLLTVPEITSSILLTDDSLVEDGKLDGSIYNEIQKFSTMNEKTRYIPKIAFIKSKTMNFFGIPLNRLTKSVRDPGTIFERTYAKPYNDVVSVLAASQYTNLPIFTLSSDAGPGHASPAEILAYIDQCDTYASLLTSKVIYIYKMIKSLTKELITQYSEWAPMFLQINAVLHKASIRTALAAVIQSASKLSCNEKLISTYFDTQSSMTYIEQEDTITGMYIATEYALADDIWDFLGNKSNRFLEITLNFGTVDKPVPHIQDFSSVYKLNEVPKMTTGDNILLLDGVKSMWDSEYWIKAMFATVKGDGDWTPRKFAQKMEDFLSSVSSIASQYSSNMQEFNSAKIRLQEVGVYNRSRLIIDSEEDYIIARTSQGASLLALPAHSIPTVKDNDNYVTMQCPVYANGINPINLSSTLLFFTPFKEKDNTITQYLYDLVSVPTNIYTYWGQKIVLDTSPGTGARMINETFHAPGYGPMRFMFSLLSRFIPNLVITNKAGFPDSRLVSLDVPLLETTAAVPIITAQIVNVISALSIIGDK